MYRGNQERKLQVTGKGTEKRSHLLQIASRRRILRRHFVSVHKLRWIKGVMFRFPVPGDIVSWRCLNGASFAKHSRKASIFQPLAPRSATLSVDNIE